MPASYSIEALFKNGGPCREPIDFHWRLIRRKGHPFLLLPVEHDAARAGLNLYSAQRAVAKMGKRLLDQGVTAPLMHLLPRFSVEADAASAFTVFLRKQAGDPVLHVPPAILFSTRANEKQRFVMLVCNQDHRPVRIVKVGLRPSAHAVIEREADFISSLPVHAANAVDVVDKLSTTELSAFAMPFFSGKNPRSDKGIETVLHSWLTTGSPSLLKELPMWQETAQVCGISEKFQVVREQLEQCVVRSTISHGDFAPWNIRVNAAGEWKVYDWERGNLKGVPGWDWFHFLVQRSILVQRHSPEAVAAQMEQFVSSARFENYAAAAGVNSVTKPLLLAYLFRQTMVVRPEQGAAATTAVLELLADKWLASPARSPGWNPAVGQSVGTAQLVRKKRTALQREMTTWVETFREVVRLFQSPAEAQGPRLSILGRFLRHWRTIVFCYLLITALGFLHSATDPRFTFLPFYLLPCGILTLVVNRRWGLFAALISSPIGPALLSKTVDDLSGHAIIFWNSFMRFLLFAFFILLLDRIRPDPKRPKKLEDA